MKIISFALWGNKPKYTKGALENIECQKKYYPDWTCRFYVDKTVPDDLIVTLSNDAEVFYMPNSDGNYGLFWRFEPLKDNTINRFIVRDVDSRLNPREAAAVKEWEESGLEFHIMRDNIQHRVPICGGMWGATNEFIRKVAPVYDAELKQFLAQLTFPELYKERGKYFNCDQPFLWRRIWPRVINSHIAHIADYKELRFTGHEKVFAVENPDGTFVGQDINV